MNTFLIKIDVLDAKKIEFLKCKFIYVIFFYPLDQILTIQVSPWRCQTWTSWICRNLPLLPLYLHKTYVILFLMLMNFIRNLVKTSIEINFVLPFGLTALMEFNAYVRLMALNNSRNRKMSDTPNKFWQTIFLQKSHMKFEQP